MALGSELQDTIAQLMGLGNFTHDQVTQALRAAFNNPDRAAEYLFTGIPANILAQQNAPAPQQQGQAPQQQQGAPMDQSGDGVDADMGGGQMPDMAAMLQQNPQLMAALMQGIAQQEGGQEMLAQLQQNPQAMMQMLQAISRGGMGGQGGMPGQGGPPPGARQIQLTEAEAASLQRLQALAPGVSQQQALQAFLVCDRNEELAANYLLDQLYN
jgi:UV excision repair protein RAD23